MKTQKGMDRFTCAYIECALWASMNDQGEPLDEIDADLSDDARERMVADCEAFQQANRALLDEALDDYHVTEEALGHDFFLTRNHHGAGYWDRGLEELGERLTRAAHAEGSADLYVENDGLIHHA